MKMQLPTVAIKSSTRVPVAYLPSCFVFFSLRISYHKFFFVCVCVLPSRINVGSEGGRQSDGRKKLALRCWVRVPYWRHHPALNYSSPCDVENKVLSLRLFGLDSLHTHTPRSRTPLFRSPSPPLFFPSLSLPFCCYYYYFFISWQERSIFLFCFLNHSNRGSICYRLPFCIVSCCVKFNALACPSFLFYYLFFQVVTIIILFLLSPFCSLACVSIE